MSGLTRFGLLAAVLASAAILLVGCGSDNGDSSKTTPQATSGNQGGGAGAAASTVKATESDFKIQIDKPSAPAGKVTFDLENKGGMPHEFVVLKTDLPEGSLPVDAEKSKVNEDAAGIVSAGEEEEYPAGESRKLTLDLKPGKYVFICNIAGHYTLGMHVAFTVDASTGS